MAHHAREDMSLDEKKPDSLAASQSPAERSPAKLEDANAGSLLNEEEALARAREQPDNTSPIYITFSPTDKDNPRNWPKMKKWYITCFASMLNVIT